MLERQAMSCKWSRPFASWGLFLWHPTNSLLPAPVLPSSPIWCQVTSKQCQREGRLPRRLPARPGNSCRPQYERWRVKYTLEHLDCHLFKHESHSAAPPLGVKASGLHIPQTNKQENKELSYTQVTLLCSASLPNSSHAPNPVYPYPVLSPQEWDCFYLKRRPSVTKPLNHPARSHK